MATYIFKLEENRGNLIKPYLFIPQPGAGGSSQYTKAGMYGSSLIEPVTEEEKLNVRGLTDWYGRPVFSDLVLKRDDNDKDEIRLISAMLTVEQRKNIVKTNLTGRNGSILEYISMGSYEVTIEGSVNNENLKGYPKDQVDALARMLEEPMALKVISEYLMMFGIYYLAIDSYRFKQNPHSETSQDLYIKCISDEMLELVIE